MDDGGNRDKGQHEKGAGGEAGPRALGINLHTRQNKRPGPFEPRGAGGLRNPVPCGTGPEATMHIVTMSMTGACPNFGSIMISLTNP